MVYECVVRFPRTGGRSRACTAVRRPLRGDAAVVKCHICEVAVGPGSQNEMYHDACGDEWQRRRAEGKCVRCGTEDAMDNRIWCYGCRDMYNGGTTPPWLGYPEAR